MCSSTTTAPSFTYPITSLAPLSSFTVLKPTVTQPWVGADTSRVSCAQSFPLQQRPTERPTVSVTGFEKNLGKLSDQRVTTEHHFEPAIGGALKALGQDRTQPALDRRVVAALPGDSC